MADTFTVNSTDDANDLDPGNNLCVSFLIVSPPFVFPFCTLRGAIEEANSLPGPDIINLPPGILNLSLAGTDEDDSATGDLDITESLTIIGQGAIRTIIDGAQLDRVIDILGPGVTVTLRDLTLLNGRVNSGLPGNLRGGAAIRNGGELILENVCTPESPGDRGRWTRYRRDSP